MTSPRSPHSRSGDAGPDRHPELRHDHRPCRPRRPTPSRASTLRVDPANMIVRAVISTADPDRAGDVIVPGGLAQRRRVSAQPSRPVGPPAVAAADRHLRAARPSQPDRIVAETQVQRLVAVRARTCSSSTRRASCAAGRSASCRPRRSRPAAAARPGGCATRSGTCSSTRPCPIPENPQALTLAVRKGLVEGPRPAALARPRRAGGVSCLNR